MKKLNRYFYLSGKKYAPIKLVADFGNKKMVIFGKSKIHCNEKLNKILDVRS